MDIVDWTNIKKIGVNSFKIISMLKRASIYVLDNLLRQVDQMNYTVNHQMSVKSMSRLTLTFSWEDNTHTNLFSWADGGHTNLLSYVL